MAPGPVTVEQSKPSLSSNDSAVLQALFDAESSPSPASATAQTDSSLPELPHISPSDVSALRDREEKAISEIQSPEASPSRTAIEQAISDLSDIIESHPKYAPAYLNRAQALRLLLDVEETQPSTGASSSSLPSPASTTAARLFGDLAQTISLLSPATPTSPVSPRQARLLANAYTHRAYILYKAAKDPDNAATRKLLPQTLQDISRDRIEEMASFDFQAGGRYGNPVAKQMAVHTNPYAKMCGAIVKDALKAEIEKWNA